MAGDACAGAGCYALGGGPAAVCDGVGGAERVESGSAVASCYHCEVYRVYTWCWTLLENSVCLWPKAASSHKLSVWAMLEQCNVALQELRLVQHTRCYILLSLCMHLGLLLDGQGLVLAQWPYVMPCIDALLGIAVSSIDAAATLLIARKIVLLQETAAGSCDCVASRV